MGANVVNGAEVGWEPGRVANPHIGVFADNGMGKTTMLRRIVAAMKESGHPRVRFHVFDGHGDVDIPDASSVTFHESSDFGFNPLELSADPEFGGVRKRIQSLIMAINRTSVRLGHRQERALTRLLVALYRREGFVMKDHTTWAADPSNGKRYPTLLDAIEYGRERIKIMATGSNQRAVNALQDVFRAAKQMRIKEEALGRTGADDKGLAKLERELQSAREKAIDAFTEAVMTAHTGDEFEEALDADGQKETLEGVIDRLENLYQIGIYRSTPPPLDTRNRVWRYIIKSLSRDEKKLFTLTRLETIFTRAVQRGITSEILDVIVLDEAHWYSTWVQSCYWGLTIPIMPMLSEAFCKIGFTQVHHSASTRSRPNERDWRASLRGDPGQSVGTSLGLQKLYLYYPLCNKMFSSYHSGLFSGEFVCCVGQRLSLPTSEGSKWPGIEQYRAGKLR